MTDRRVLRYEVPVDDQWHRIDCADYVVHVDCRNADVVEFWATEDVMSRRVDTGAGEFVSVKYEAAPHFSDQAWEYRVYGTGHTVDGLYVGTAISPSGTFVWHLFRREVAL